MLTIEQVVSKVDRLIAKKEMLVSEKDIAKKSLNSLNRLALNIEDAQAIVRLVASDTQNQLAEKISGIVTMALNAVFEEDVFEFKLEYEEKRGKTEANMFLLVNGNETDIMEGGGGGAADVVALALRVALWNICVPKPAPILIFDEPCKFISRDLQYKAGKIMKLLHEKLGMQIIVVSHDDPITENADRVFMVNRVEDKDGNKVSVVKEK